MLRDALQAQENLCSIAALKSTARAAFSTVRTVAEFVGDVSNAIDEARSRNARFSGAQW